MKPEHDKMEDLPHDSIRAYRHYTFKGVPRRLEKNPEKLSVKIKRAYDFIGFPRLGTIISEIVHALLWERET